jgi:hypothetical protein
MTLRVLACAAACALVVACAPPAADKSAAADASCNRVVTRQMTLLGGAKPDYMIEVRAFDGPPRSDPDSTVTHHPCVDATVLLTVRRIGDSAFVHGFVTSMNRMDLIEGHAGPVYDGARVQDFLDEWSKVTVTTTDSAPARQSEVTTFGFTPELYEKLRSQKAPMVCHATGVHDEMCLFLEPQQPFVLQPFYSRQQL